MNSSIPIIFLPIVAGVAFFVVCSRFGYFCDGKVNEDFKDRLRKRLKPIKKSNNDGLARLFFTMFNRLFDPKETGRPQFWRASLASISILLFMFLIAVLADVGIITNFGLGDFIIFLIFFAVPINIIGDYFSLWETRIVIGRMASAGRRKRQALLLLLDLVASVIIYFLGLALGTMVIVLLFPNGNLSSFLDVYTRIVIQMFSLDFLAFNIDKEYVFFAICFYTTLLTSVWAWAFMLGATLWPLCKRMESVLDTQKFPVGVIMTIGGIPLSLIIVVFGYLDILFFQAS